MGNIPRKRSKFIYSGFILLLGSFSMFIFGQSKWRECGPLPEEGEVYFSIAYGHSRYVATGQFGTIVVSPDSIGWFGRAADIPDMLLWSVAFENGMLC